MKIIYKTLISFMVLCLINVSIIYAQQEEKRPEYVTVTKMHWNMDQKDFDMDTWKSVEKEYMDKVTAKNEYVMGASYYVHQFTADNTELLYVQSYASWEDIDKASKKNGDLEKVAWANENARKAYLKKQNNYYSNDHSDEIYATMPGAKFMTKTPDKDMVLYVRKSHFSFPQDGTQEEFNKLRKESLENVINKNEYIKAYYPSVHAWGADKTEFIEAFIVESLADIDKMFDKNTELNKAKWSDENVRKSRGKKMSKYFTGVHGDYIYTAVAGLSK